MGTTSNILTLLGGEPVVKREMDNTIAILTTARSHPAMITKALEGFKLGLFDREWAEHTATPSGTSTYHVRLVPIWQGMTDPDGTPLQGVPNTITSSKGVVFAFDPFPDGFSCDGYRVYADDGDGTTMYFQGTQDGRFNTTFSIPGDYTYSEAGATLSPIDDRVPPFVHAHEVYQTEGAINTRIYLGGGKKYDTGYAQVAKSTIAPVLKAGTEAESTYGTWAAIRNASFRMRIDGEVYDFVNIDFDGDGSMANVATTLQVAINSAQQPKLISGDNVSTTLADYTAITDGSFNVFINGKSHDVTGLDFSSESDLFGVAAVISTAINALSNVQGSFRWDATAGKFILKVSDATGSEVIVNGGFGTDSDWTKNATASISGGEAHFPATNDNISQDKNVDLTNSTWAISLRAKMSSGSTATGVVVAYFGANEVLNKRGPTWVVGSLNYVTVSGQITLDSAVAYDSIGITGRFGGNATGIEIDDVSLIQVTVGELYLSFLSRHSDDSTGTDISTLLKMRGTDTGVILNRRAKVETTETVVWSTDHFVFTGSSTGESKRLSFLASAVADVGTDISTATYLDGLSGSTDGTYTPGQTKLRSVLGNGTDWASWAEGTNFRIKTEAGVFLVDQVRSATELILDVDYEGDGVDGFKEYVLEPFDAIVYISELGNPFHYDSTNYVRLPTNDSDGITAIRKSGRNIVILMSHHVWIMPHYAITSPTLVSEHVGVPNSAVCIEYQGGLAVFTGADFVNIRGGKVRTLDPENRMGEIISRISTSAPEPHGVFLPKKKDSDEGVLMWFVGLDGARVINTAIVFDPKLGIWYLYNLKDANVSTIIRDDGDNPHLVTASRYDSAHSVPSFHFIHGNDYKTDGGSDVTGTTKQGVIAAGGVGSATETSGYLTCTKAGTSTAATWATITNAALAVTIDNTELLVSGISFTGDTTMPEVAATLQSAIRAVSGGSETVTFPVDRFIITSGTTTNQSNVSYLRPYYPTTDITDITDKTYMNGRVDQGTETGAVSKITLTLRNMDDDADASFSQAGDGEAGIYVLLCDTNLDNVQYLKIVSNTATTITITPNPSRTPVAGEYYYIGGMDPTWLKWMDFGSPQHKNKIFGIAVTTEPVTGTDGNRLAAHGMADLSTTVRTHEVVALGGDADSTNSLHLKDEYVNQQGIKIHRPGAVHDLTITDINITHTRRR